MPHVQSLPLLSSLAPDADLPTLGLRLGLAFGGGCVVAGVHRWTQDRRDRDSAPLLPTLVLLTILIAMITLVIGDSIARAFSLVGALAIVRFRTVVEDTRDTAFVMFAVAVGMAVGAGYWQVAALGVPVVAAAAWLFRGRRAAPPTGVARFAVTLRAAGGIRVDDKVQAILAQRTQSWQLKATATARQGSAIDLAYGIELPPTAVPGDLLAELHRLEGVQEVELRRD